MICELFHVFAEPVGTESLQCLENLCMERASPPLEEAAVGHLVSQRVLECVLELGEQTSLIEKLCCLQASERLSDHLLRLFDDRFEQRERHVLADYGRCLKQSLVFRRKVVDSSGQHRLRCGGKVKALDRPRQAVGTAFTREGPRLEQHPNALLDEEGIALSALDQKPLELPQIARGPEQRLQ